MTIVYMDEYKCWIENAGEDGIKEIFEGSVGMAKMAEIMNRFHKEVGIGYEFAEKKI